MEKSTIISISSIISAVFASICCIGPVALAFFGLGGTTFFTIFDTYRPYFIGMALVLLGFAFYFTYRKREIKCEDGTCKIESAGKWNKISVWLVTIITIVAILFPYRNIVQSNVTNVVRGEPMSFQSQVNCCEMDSKSECITNGVLDPSKLSIEENTVRKYIYEKIINEKRAPDIKEITTDLKFSDAKDTGVILKKLHRVGFIHYENGEILGAFPFSPKPTLNKVIFYDGRWVYAMCAWDALGISKMMKQSLIIESITPLDRKIIRAIFKEDKLESISPENAIVWWSESEGSFAKVRCGEINFFSDENELQRWQKLNPDKKGTPLSVNLAIAQSQTWFGNRY